MSSPNKENSIIVKDVHCPFCNSDNALLINRAEAKKVSLQLPAFGLKYILGLMYLTLLYIWIHGKKIIEAKKEIENVTYAFCPNCGNGYSMAPPESVKDEIEEARFCKVRDGKVIMGLCKGISEYTGISILWIRIKTVFFGFTIIGALLYFLIGACVPFKDELDSEIPDKRFYRINKGNGNMVTERCYDSYGSLGSWYEYTYDSNGNMVTERRYDSYGSLDYWYEYTYDSNGNMVTERCYDSYGSLDYWYEYTYIAMRVEK